jgi:phosphopantetheinyl transferase (holo-ACP synthase)
VTPKSQVADIRVSDGNGTLLLATDGYEELTERVPEEYCRLVLSPASAYLTQPLSPEFVGSPATAIASSWVVDIPYAIFERNSTLWLKTVSQIILCEGERKAFAEMPGTVQRRTEWLFGRIAAKEAVRRFLNENYQARWSSADIQIWADDQGKPHALGAWADLMSVRLDLAISHTRDFVVAVVASNARVGVDVESAAREYRRLEALIAEREAILSERDALDKMISAEEQALSHYDEQGLREQISVNIDEVTPKAIAEAERTRGFLAEKLRILSNKISGIENTVISLRATAEDPLPISDELCELQTRHEKNSRFYDALTLAMESIESASNAMRGNVTPAISRQASELLSKLSGGRYDTLRTTGTLGVSLDKDGYSIKSELLSAGTRDAAYLALRLALFMRIYEGELPPLVLDESLCQLDEKRAERTITLLCGLAGEGIQTLLFTSHKREGEMCERVGAEYRMISLSQW